MPTRVRRIRLNNPAKIPRDELDGAKLGVIVYNEI